MKTTKMKKIASSMVLLPVLLLFTNATNVSKSTQVQKDYSKTISVVDWIYSPKLKRRPTNNLGWFYGNKLNFWNSKKNPINGADVSFGYLLYYTYDMYCKSKNRSKNCLGSKLKVSYRIEGSKKNGSKVMQVNVLGGSTITSNYFQEVISKFYGNLESIGGKASISSSDRAVIQPRPKLTRATANFKTIISEK